MKLRALAIVAMLFTMTHLGHGATAVLTQSQGARHWMIDHLSMEWIVGQGGWRTGIAQDSRIPGFDVAAGGGEFIFGFDVGRGLGVVATGRVLAGRESGDFYLEGMGGLGLQVRLSNAVRVRLGPAAGQARLRDDAGTLIGGFVATSIDLFPLGSGRLSSTLGARLDMDALIHTRRELPTQSYALTAGLGLRY